MDLNTDLDKCIRLYNALNWPAYNQETRELMENDSDCQIAIGTDSLSVGVDISNVQDVIILDGPEDIDDLVQKFGRPGRDLRLAADPCGILYVTEKTMETAQIVLESSKPNGSRPKKAQSQAKNEETMDPSMAEMYLAPCKPSEQDRQYDNPAEETPCGCQGCEVNPPPKRTYPCRCSGCMPEVLTPSSDNPQKRKPKSAEFEVPKSKRLTKVMREHGTKHSLSIGGLGECQ
jgi:superfamily II DNA/RNA helicase